MDDFLSFKVIFEAVQALVKVNLIARVTTKEIET